MWTVVSLVVLMVVGVHSQSMPSPSITANPSVPTEGQNLTLTCVSPSDVTASVYQWLKDFGNFPSDTSSNKLTFSPVTSADSGSYRCQYRDANNAASDVSQPFEFSDWIREIQNTTQIKTRESNEYLICDGGRYSPGIRYCTIYIDGHRYQDDNDCSFAIPHSVTGSYTCSTSTSNNTSAQGTSTTIRYIDAPTIKPTTKNPQLLNQSYSLECVTDATDATFSWYSSSNNIISISTSKFLTFANLNTSAENSYLCRIRVQGEEFTSDHFHFYFQNLQVPQISTYQQQRQHIYNIVYYTFNYAQGISCKSNGAEGFTLYRDGQRVGSQADRGYFYVFLDGGIGAKYSCSATTVYGESQHSRQMYINGTEELVITTSPLLPILDNEVTLTCSPQFSDKDIRYRWIILDEFLVATSRYPVVQEGQTLTIIPVDESDIALYVCEAQSNGRVRRSDVYVLAFQPPEAPFISQSSEKFENEELGRRPEVTSTIMCQCQGVKCDPKNHFRLYKDGVMVRYVYFQDSVREHYGLFDIRRQYLIDVSQPGSSGKYTCTESNAHGESAHSHGVIIHATGIRGDDVRFSRNINERQSNTFSLPMLKPLQPLLVFDIEAEGNGKGGDYGEVHYTFRTGENIPLRCYSQVPRYGSHSGRVPEADVNEYRLLKDGQPAENNNPSGHFIITGLPAGLYNYTCQATNRIGDSPLSYDLLVSVTDTPSITASPASPTLGNTLTLTCNTELTSDGFDIIWKKNGKILPEKSNVLLLDNLSEYDEGDYVCRQKHGSVYLANSESYILVFGTKAATPQIFTTPTDVEKGTHVTLRCLSTSTTSSMSVFYHNGNAVATVMDKDLDDAGQILFIFRIFFADQSDGGDYTCTVENSLGQSDMSQSLTITILDESKCVAGFYKTDSGICSACDYGTYQPDADQTSCLMCPAGFSTQVIGATAESQCVIAVPDTRKIYLRITVDMTYDADLASNVSAAIRDTMAYFRSRLPNYAGILTPSVMNGASGSNEVVVIVPLVYTSDVSLDMYSFLGFEIYSRFYTTRYVILVAGPASTIKTLNMFVNEDDAMSNSNIVDIDECSARRTVCSALSTCTNLVGGIGSFTCDCVQGYQRLSQTAECTDIDECLTGSVCTGLNEKCVNVPGNFVCDCIDGFTRTPQDDCSMCDAGQFGRECSGICDCVRDNTMMNVCDSMSGSCLCQTGWKGTDCSEDINECSTVTSSCSDPNSSCVNEPGSYRCTCNDGYFVRNSTTGICEMCDANFHGPSCSLSCRCNPENSVCNNVDGTCQCQSGWQGTTCEDDIDECSRGTFNCSSYRPVTATCVNLPGSYECMCPTGYTRNDALKKCEDVDECASPGLNVCEHSCTNTEGSYTCTCPPGFAVAPSSNGTCLDVDECASPGLNVCEHNCTNTEGSYMCTCPPGFAVASSSNGTCLDIDECQQRDACSLANQTCTNTWGNYTCTCNDGYALTTDGNKCTAVYILDFTLRFPLFEPTDAMLDPATMKYKDVSEEIQKQVHDRLIGLRGFVRFDITRLRRGSLECEGQIIVDKDNTNVAGETVYAVSKMNTTGMTVNGATHEASKSIANTEITSSMSQCELRQKAEPCTDGQICVENDDGVSVCQSDDDDDDDTDKWIGIGIGIVAAVIIIVSIIIAVCVMCHQKSRRYIA